MTSSVIYLTSSCDDQAIKDPLVKRLGQINLRELFVSGETTTEEIRQQVRKFIEQSNDKATTWVIILNAFLNPEKEGVDSNGLWEPEISDLEEFMNTKHQRCLKSILLMWSLWRILRGSARILVTTNDVRMSRRYRLALHTAFSDGLACSVYSWGDSDALLSDIAKSIN